MSQRLILASSSSTRAELLHRAHVPFDVSVPRLDEVCIKDALVADGVGPRDMADALASAKARKVSSKIRDAVVLGCDQVLSFDGKVLSKPQSKEDAVAQLSAMQGKRHMLFSAAVIFEDGEPTWRHIGQVRLFMRQTTESWIVDYVDRNWDSIQYSVGAYKLEEEGVRLFDKIEGDYFNVLGMPLLEILSYLTLRGILH